jgi:ATP-dependent helicase/nuclease subunit A
MGASAYRGQELMTAKAHNDNDPQARASDPAGSAWVSANAGSGKTHVLVNRVIRLLLNGTAPERILCLTFTRAAAAEMSTRLFNELAGWIALNNDDLVKRIHERVGDVTFARDQLISARQLFARALETPGGLKVQTIHAFCERLLQRFPVEAGMVPGFEVMDDQTAREVLGGARAQVLAKARTDPDGDTARDLATLVARTSADKFDDLLKQLLSKRHELAGMLDSEAHTERSLDELRIRLGLAPGETQESIRAAAVAAVDKSAYGEVVNSPFAPKDCRSRCETLLAAASVEKAFLALYEVFYGKSGPRKDGGLFSKKAEDQAPHVQDFLLAERVRIETAIDKLKAVQIHELTSALVRVGLRIMLAYEDEKRRRGLSDYDDLITRTRELLEEKEASLWVLYKLDGGLDHILIDEAQDTSPQQWKIIEKLSEEFFAGEGSHDGAPRTVFAVGDYKQSIFSFQGADPAEFARMQTHFTQQVTGSGAQFEAVPLLASFRSTAEVLETVDKVFAQEDVDIGLIDGVQAHTPRRVDQAGVVELWPLVRPVEDDMYNRWQAPRRIDAGRHPRLTLAHEIARTIRHWIDNETMLEARGRAMRYGDILILVRQRTTFMDALVRALKLANIPVAGADRLKLTQHLAVQDLMALARFVLLPEDDLTLAAVLKGPLVRRNDGKPISEDDLFDLAHGRGTATLWQRLNDKVSEGAPLGQALEDLHRWRVRAGFMTPYEFFSQVLVRDKGRELLLARLGTEASDPIEAFMIEALNFQAGHSPSLLDFLGWLEGAGLEIKRDMDHSGDEVRIMTVHGAKGLEANVVILPDTTDVPESRKDPDILFLPGEQGPLPVWRLRQSDETDLVGAVRETTQSKTKQEYLRLLYVAMTRARDQLYIGGFSMKEDVKDDSWYALIRAIVERPENEAHDPIHDRKVFRIAGRQSGEAVDDSKDDGLAVEPAEPPQWAQGDAPPEPVGLKWFVPSKLGRGGEAIEDEPERADPPLQDGSADRYRRGNLIHKLLQLLPDMTEDERAAAALRYLSRPGQALDEREAAGIVDEVMRVIGDPVFAPVFGPGSRAEVPLAAQVSLGGRRIGLTGQIDRLLVRPGDIMIVDYKTNRPPPATIEAADRAYVRQLAAYRRALHQLYPDRDVRAALLWTNTTRLMEVPARMMDQAL